MKGRAWKYLLIASSAAMLVGASCERTDTVFVSHSALTGPSSPQPDSPAEASATTTSQAKTLYLTFDADMTPGMLKRLRSGKVSAWYDPSIISILDSRRVPATIFTTGLFAEAYPDLIRKLASDGNYSFGNHSYDHAGFEIPCYGLPAVSTDAAKLDEMTKTQRILKDLTGRSPAYFRYPGLCRNAHDDELVAAAGLRVDDGTVMSGDAFNKNSQTIVRAVLKSARPGGVILMHLGGPNAPATGAALKELIPKLEEEGYSFGKL